MFNEPGGGAVSPPFSFSGVCIVAGNAWCLHEDLAEARKILGDVPVIAVNGASREVKSIALYSCHPHRFVEKGSEWIRHQRRLFGEGFTVHSSNKTKHGDLPYVQYWWHIPGGGGSAWGARKVAKLMGFNTVVLCGCPLLPGNYTGGRLGMNMTKAEVTEQYASEIASDTDWHKGAYSMSGRTREILGCLP